MYLYNNKESRILYFVFRKRTKKGSVDDKMKERVEPAF